MAKERVAKDTRVNEKPVRVSFPHLFKARAVNDGTPSYSIVIMLNKNDPQDMAFLKQLHQDMTEALQECWPDVNTRPANPLIGGVDSPIKDGDSTPNKKGILLKNKYPEYEGHYIIRAGCREDNGRPGVVDANGQKILDANEVYGGCWGRVGVNVYTFDNSLNAGVTVGLNGFQKTADGESFGSGRPSTEEMFGKFGGTNPTMGQGGDPFANTQPGNTPPVGQPAPANPMDESPF